MRPAAVPVARPSARLGLIGVVMTSQGRGETASWTALLAPATMPALAVLLGGILLHSINVLLLATIMPGIVADIRGEAMIAWPTTAYLASSIIATTMTGRLVASWGAAPTFCGAALVFAAGSFICAMAPTIGVVVTGRFLQGFGGGLLSALSYVLARQVFPLAMLPRVLAAMTSIWSIAALVGPLVGGVFVTYASWRAAFIAVGAFAIAIALTAFLTLPREAPPLPSAARSIPKGLMALVALSIALMSLAAVIVAPAMKLLLIVGAVMCMILMVLANARSLAPLLPTDAFSPRSQTGVGLWLVALLSMSFSPVNIYAPILLQKLHGFAPLAAGYAVGGAAASWTFLAIAVASTSRGNADRLIVAGPLIVGAGLLWLGLSLGPGPAATIVLALLAIGAGMGAAWSFTAQRVMARPLTGEGDLAASSVATVQQTGFALGSAVAGIFANAAGFTLDAGVPALVETARIVPLAFIPFALLAAGAGVLLARQPQGQS